MKLFKVRTLLSSLGPTSGIDLKGQVPDLCKDIKEDEVPLILRDLMALGEVGCEEIKPPTNVLAIRGGHPSYSYFVIKNPAACEVS